MKTDIAEQPTLRTPAAGHRQFKPPMPTTSDGNDVTRRLSAIRQETKLVSIPEPMAVKKHEKHPIIAFLDRNNNKVVAAVLLVGVLFIVGLVTGWGGGVAQTFTAYQYQAECFVNYTPDPIIIVQIDSNSGDASALCSMTVQKSNNAWAGYDNPATPIAGIACSVPVGHVHYTVYDEGYTKGMDMTHRLSFDYICARLGLDGRLPEQGF